MTSAPTGVSPRAPRWIPLAQLLVFGAGLASFLGWAFDLPWLTDWTGTGISIQPNTTLCVMAASLGVLCLAWQRPRLALLLGGFMALLAGATLVQWVAGVDLGIDEALTFGRTWGRVGVIHPGRMGPPGSTAWLLLGLGLVFASLPRRGPRRVVPFLGLFTAGLATLSLVGWLYGATRLYTIPTLTIIAFQTAIFILVVSLGLLACQRDWAPVRLLRDPGMAGALTRRTLVALVIIPVAVGLLLITGERHGLYDSTFRAALRTLVEAGLLLVLLYLAARLLASQEARRRAADAAQEAADARHAEERERLLASERAARAEAEASSRAKEEFLATLSHELRTPLNAILGWTHLLRQDLGDPVKARAALDVIERGGRRQAHLVADILDVSRTTAGKLRVERVPVDLGAVVAGAFQAVEPGAQTKGVTLHAEIADDARAVTGDAARLEQVLWNLLVNAVKFTPSGGRVDVSLARRGDVVVLRVRDTGEGIPAEFLPHVFERFRQADPSPGRAHEGLGIGLALVKDLVTLHSGTVTAASEGPGRGATFTVELPAARPTTENEPA